MLPKQRVASSTLVSRSKFTIRHPSYSKDTNDGHRTDGGRVYRRKGERACPYSRSRPGAIWHLQATQWRPTLIQQTMLRNLDLADLHPDGPAPPESGRCVATVQTRMPWGASPAMFPDSDIRTEGGSLTERATQLACLEGVASVRPLVRTLPFEDTANVETPCLVLAGY